MYMYNYMYMYVICQTLITVIPYNFRTTAVYNQFKQTEKEKTLFSLKGIKNADKRMTLYTFLLSHMADEHRFQLTAKLCQVLKEIDIYYQLYQVHGYFCTVNYSIMYSCLVMFGVYTVYSIYRLCYNIYKTCS